MEIIEHVPNYAINQNYVPDLFSGTYSTPKFQT